MRKKHLLVFIPLGLLLTTTPAHAAAKVFKNCTELNKVYSGGVALPGAVNAGGATKLTPKYDKALYLANKKSDRDKDGIACEKQLLSVKLKFIFASSLSSFALLFSIIVPYSATAEAKWNLISSQDYIFGFTSYKYACWSGSFTNAQAPVLQVYDNGRWIDAAKGQILPTGSDISTPCETAYPIAVGYQWTVMNPAPPSGLSGGQRYNILYRQKLPDTVTKVAVQVTKSVPEDVIKTRLVPKTVKKPYIATVTKKGKKTQVIKYKKRTKYVEETYTETVQVQKTVTDYQDQVTPGYTSTNGNVLVYPSESALTSSYSELANALACGLGRGTNCKK